MFQAGLTAVLVMGLQHFVVDKNLNSKDSFPVQIEINYQDGQDPHKYDPSPSIYPDDGNSHHFYVKSEWDRNTGGD